MKSRERLERENSVLRAEIAALEAGRISDAANSIDWKDARKRYREAERDLEDERSAAREGEIIEENLRGMAYLFKVLFICGLAALLFMSVFLYFTTERPANNDLPGPSNPSESISAP